MVLRYGCWAILCLILSARGFAQEPTPLPTPPETPIRVFAEEVQLNVSAQTSAGRFDPTVTKDDLLVTENTVPQQIESLRRAEPASVLLLLDTGSDLSFAKNLTLTRAAAKLVLLNAPNEFYAVMQYHDKVETLSDWTQNQWKSFLALDKKLFSGRRSRLVEAVGASLEMFKSRQRENRHLVLISDGAESVADGETRRAAFERLLAANITIHVLSYTQLEEQQAARATKRFKINKEKTTPRLPDWLVQQLALALPDSNNLPLPDSDSDRTPRKIFKAMNEAQRIGIVDLDNERRRKVGEKREIWRETESEMKNLARDAGGVFDAPESEEGMFIAAAEVGQAIGSQYVVTYTPKRPIADSTVNQTRLIRVVSRRVGLRVQARQKIIVADKAK